MIEEVQTTGRAASAAEHVTRERRSAAVLIALVVFFVSLLADVRVLPSDAALGQDYNDFYVAAVAQRDGLNPYDGAVLTRIEEKVFGKSSFSNTVASPPAFFVVLRPLTTLAPRPGYLLMLAASVLIYVTAIIRLCIVLDSTGQTGGGLGIARWGFRGEPGWPSLLVWALAFSPPAIITLFLGQVTLLVAAAFIWAIVAVLAGHAVRAGLLLSLTLVIPHVMAVPIALVCGLTWRRGGRQAALATAIWAAAICLMATLFAEPGSFGHWLRAIFTYGDTFDHWQPDLSSLAGVYIPYVPRMAGRLLSVLAVGAAMLCAGAIIAGARQHQPGSERWWQWLMLGCSIWLMVLPYEHPYDAVLLVPAILVLLAAERGRARRGAAVAAVVAMICLPELDLMGFRPNLTFSYTVIPAILTVCALGLRLRQGTRPAATAATVPQALPALQSVGGTAGPDRA